jgi:uncharacterized protein (TIGR02246 family)
MLSLRHCSTSLVLFIVVACAAPSPEAAAPVDVNAVKEAIQSREKEWSAAYLAADAAGVAALYTEDAASVPPTGDWTRGRDAIAKDNSVRFDSTTYTAREDITEEVIPAGPDYIFEIGHYSSTGTSKADGTPRAESGRYTVLWRKDADGVWRIVRDMGSAAPETTAKTP